MQFIIFFFCQLGSTGVDFKNYSYGKYENNTDALKYYGTPQTWSSNYPEYVNQGGGSYNWHTFQQPSNLLNFF
jgi:hypothetical protein